jgi:hypothetical protein
MNGARGASNGGCGWRAEATPAQLARAADGLEQIADTCAGRRREELLEMAGDLRERAFARRLAERRHATPLRLLTGA